MTTYTQGDPRTPLSPADLATYQGNGSLVLDTRRTRPSWFDGRFLAARDLVREQNYFLQREADLGQAPGFGITLGLKVKTVSSTPDTIVIGKGQGVTPAGELVKIPNNLTVRISDLIEQQSLDAEFGLATAPATKSSSRSGLYVIALQPVQFTANPITAYPTSVTGKPSKTDGDIVEAAVVLLVPYPGPAGTNDAATLHAALARQIFLTGNASPISESVLPLTMVSLQGGAIEWMDPWLVRRETGATYSGVRFGLTDPATQQAYLLQYDTQLQQAVKSLVSQKLPARFAASAYFNSLPPAGRFPIASIDTDAFTQIYFPPQIDVRVSIVPEDEIPALIADSLSLPPIDLTLDPSGYANLAVFALIPVPRQGFAALAAQLPNTALNSVLPQVLGNRLPLDLLRFYQGSAGVLQASGADDSAWQTAIGTQTWGWYLRRRSSPPVVNYKTPPPPPTTTTTTTTPKPTTTTTTTTTPTPKPTTTTTTTTTPKPTTTTTTTTTTTPKPTTTTTTTTTPKPTTTTTTTTTPKPTTTTTTTTTPKPTTTTTTTTPKPTATTSTTTARPTTTTTTTRKPTPTTPTTNRPINDVLG